MKKIAQCAVLLAFTLAFVGCNLQDDEPEGTPTLQDALNNNEPVNLDEYNPSASETYTISKSKVITGNAKGTSFAIADGVNVTFDGTKNIGTVTVGTVTRAATARAAQGTNGATITLKGNGVTINKVFIYVENCTLDSESTGNSFKNVVVAPTVKTLALNGKTNVSTLVSSSTTSTASITITVTADVTITKADSTVIKAVETSNPTVTINITKVSDQELEDLKEAFEEESKKDPVDSTNFITSKDDLIKCVKNIIKKYYDFAREIEDRNSRNRAATASKDDISSQLKTAFDAVFQSFLENEELGRNFIKLFTGEGATKNIRFESKIDLTNVGVNTGLDAFIDFANYAQDYFPNDEDDEEAAAPDYATTVRKASDTEQITRKTLFGSNYETVNDFLNIADKYASVPKLYLLGKLNVKAAATGNADYASATAKANIEIEATNINNMIPEFFQAYSNNIDHTYVPTSVNLPVTAVKPFINVDANVALTRNQYDDFVQKCKDMPGWEDDFQYEAYRPKYPDYPENPFYYPEFDWNSDYTDEEWQQYCKDREAAREKFEQEKPELVEQYRQAQEQWQKDYEQYRKESEAFDWNAYWDGYDAAWDAWYDKHRKEIKDYFLKANYASKECSCKINAGVSTTVTSTATVPGGIITLSLEGNYTDPGKIIAFMMEGPMGSDYVEVLKELEKDYGIVPTVIVTDYNGKQTLKLSGINEILDIITEIVDNIGDIIH